MKENSDLPLIAGACRLIPALALLVLAAGCSERTGSAAPNLQPGQQSQAQQPQGVPGYDYPVGNQAGGAAGGDTADAGVPADTSPDSVPPGARRTYESALAYVRGLFERDGGRVQAAMLSNGTTASGATGMFVCGLARDGRGRNRAFIARAAESGQRDLFETDAAGRANHPVWQAGCSAPLADEQGPIGFGDTASF